MCNMAAFALVLALVSSALVTGFPTAKPQSNQQQRAPARQQSTFDLHLLRQLVLGDDEDELATEFSVLQMVGSDEADEGRIAGISRRGVQGSLPLCPPDMQCADVGDILTDPVSGVDCACGVPQSNPRLSGEVVLLPICATSLCPSSGFIVIEEAASGRECVCRAEPSPRTQVASLALCSPQDCLEPGEVLANSYSGAVECMCGVATSSQ